MKKPLLLQNNSKVGTQVTAVKCYVKCRIPSINNKMGSLFERLIKILQENIIFWQKELTSKDKIFKTLIKTNIYSWTSVVLRIKK